MTKDREYAEALRNHQDADDLVWLAAIKRAIEVLETHEARIGELAEEWVSETAQELAHRQEQVVEARRIAALCYEARVGDPSAVDAAIEAWLNRSWKGEP